MTERRIKSAERTLALFELFSHEQRPMSVSEISRGIGIPQPSTSMLLRNLAELGYLEHDRNERTYIPTIRIMLLSSWIHRRFVDNGHLEWRLEQLKDCVGETTFLGVLNGLSVQYILGVGKSWRYPRESSHEQYFEVPRGSVRPIAFTASGRVLLSLKYDDEILRIVLRANAECTEDRFRVKISDFMSQIREIRARGYAETSGDMTPGLGAIAKPIPNLFGATAIAVGVGGPVQRLRRKRKLILEALHEFVRAFQEEGKCGLEHRSVTENPKRDASGKDLE